MIYLDTNILVALLATDSTTARASAWVAAQEAPFATSEWAKAEFFAAIGLQQRKGELKLKDAREIGAEFAARIAQHFVGLAAPNAAAALAAQWLRDPACSLQAGDALHLAIASLGGAAVLATLDERFAKSAKRLRLANIQIELIPAMPPKVEQSRARYAADRRDGAKPSTRLRKPRVTLK